MTESVEAESRTPAGRLGRVERPMGEGNSGQPKRCPVCGIELVRTGSGGVWGNKDARRGSPTPGRRVEIYRCPRCGKGYVYDPVEGILDDLK